jgi:hypothetical protein
VHRSLDLSLQFIHALCLQVFVPIVPLPEAILLQQISGNGRQCGTSFLPQRGDGA